MKPTVEYVSLSPSQAAKMLSPHVEFVGKELRSITLTLPLMQASNYLILRLPHDSLKELTTYIKTLPKAQKMPFIYDWLMKNQNVALDKYTKSKSKNFTYDPVPLKLSGVIPALSTSNGLGTKESPYLSTLPEPSKITGKAKTKVVIPLVVHVDGVESSFHFKIDLTLIQLSKSHLSSTGAAISHIVKNQIVKWAEERHIDSGSKEFKSALHETISTISPNIREQTKRLKSRHPEWSKYLDSH